MSVIAPSTKEQIVLAAEGLFAERGIEGVSLRQIGAAAGQRQQLGGAVPLRHQGTARPGGVRVPPPAPPRAARPAARRAPSRRPPRRGSSARSRWMFEQSELDDSNYMSFVSMLTPVRSHATCSTSSPTTSSPSISDVPRAHLVACSGHLAEPLAHASHPRRPWRRRARRRRPRARPRDRSAGAAVRGRARRPRRRHGRLPGRRRSRARRLAALERAEPVVTDRCSHPGRLDRPARPRAIPARSPRSGYPDDVWTQLRAEAPVAWFEPDGLRAVLGDHQARRHRRRRVAAGARSRTSTG